MRKRKEYNLKSKINKSITKFKKKIESRKRKEYEKEINLKQIRDMFDYE